MRDPSISPIYFSAPGAWRAWLARHGASATDRWLGFYKVGAAQRGITFAQAVDEALCAGWIDGVRRRVDDARFVIRFTPGQPRSIWSAVNIKRVGELAALGLMLPSGEAAFDARDVARSKVYSFEQRDVTLADAYAQQLRADESAWRWFQTQPASYHKMAVWWVMSAKREETRAKRLATLIVECAAGRRLEQFTK